MADVKAKKDKSTSEWDKSKGKVVVAMSGGVDSSVAAALLQLQGYDVIGMSIQTFDNEVEDDKERFDSCCSISDMDDARRVCESLGIPHYIVNAVDAFDHFVIDNFVGEYLSGRTPNPCVLCNNFIKFDFLLEKAYDVGAKYVATGHYAKVKHNSVTGRYSVLRAVDETKDQSYYLFGLTQDQLARTILPLGDLRKIQVRKMAEQFGLLRVSQKRDSHEICFVGKDGYAAFIEKRVGKDLFKEGTFEIATNNMVVGTHDGIHNYTIGQRKGLPEKVHQALQKMGYKDNLYINKINPRTGTVYLADQIALNATKFMADKFNWMAGGDFSKDRKVQVRIRSMHKPSEASVRLFAGDRVIITFDEPQRAVTPGQAVVIYEGDEVVGGGWISTVMSDNAINRII